MNLKHIIEKNDTPAGRAFDIVIQSLILVSLISFTVDTLPNLESSFRKILQVLEVVIVLIFTFEYIARVTVADSKLRFIFSFYGLIDLTAILPFYLATGLDLRSLRGFRMLRLFRAFKLMRYSKAIKRFHQAFLIVKEELVIFLCAALLVLFLSAVGIYYFENDVQPDKFQSVFDGLWWAIISLTTVGYGDIYPVTIGGKVFTFFVLIIGLGIVAVPTGLVASALSQARKEEQDSNQ